MSVEIEGCRTIYKNPRYYLHKWWSRSGGCFLGWTRGIWGIGIRLLRVV